MKTYQRYAVKLASEILAQPQFQMPQRDCVPHKWCTAKRINAECRVKKEVECRGDRVTCGCDFYRQIKRTRIT